MIAKSARLASGGLTFSFSGTKSKTNQEMKIIVRLHSSILCFPTSGIRPPHGFISYLQYIYTSVDNSFVQETKQAETAFCEWPTIL